MSIGATRVLLGSARPTRAVADSFPRRRPGGNRAGDRLIVSSASAYSRAAVKNAYGEVVP